MPTKKQLMEDLKLLKQDNLLLNWKKQELIKHYDILDKEYFKVCKKYERLKQKYEELNYNSMMNGGMVSNFDAWIQTEHEENNPAFKDVCFSDFIPYEGDFGGPDVFKYQSSDDE
jgi:hypothetical protein